MSAKDPDPTQISVASKFTGITAKQIARVSAERTALHARDLFPSVSHDLGMTLAHPNKSAKSPAVKEATNPRPSGGSDSKLPMHMAAGFSKAQVSDVTDIGEIARMLGIDQALLAERLANNQGPVK